MWKPWGLGESIDRYRKTQESKECRKRYRERTKYLEDENRNKPDYIEEITAQESIETSNIQDTNDNEDELYNQAIEIIKNEGKASTSFLQRKLQIGYNRAARIIDMMEEKNIVSKANHVGKREVL